MNSIPETINKVVSHPISIQFSFCETISTRTFLDMCRDPTVNEKVPIKQFPQEDPNWKLYSYETSTNVGYFRTKKFVR